MCSIFLVACPHDRFVFRVCVLAERHGDASCVAGGGGPAPSGPPGGNRARAGARTITDDQATALIVKLLREIRASTRTGRPARWRRRQSLGAGDRPRRPDHAHHPARMPHALRARAPPTCSPPSSLPESVASAGNRGRTAEKREDRLESRLRASSEAARTDPRWPGSGRQGSPIRPVRDPARSHGSVWNVRSPRGVRRSRLRSESSTVRRSSAPDAPSR